MANTGEDDYRNAIAALNQYQRKLIEICDTMQRAVNQTSQNLQGDANVKRIDESLQKYVINIHEVSMFAQDLAKQLSLQLDEIINSRNSISI